MLENGQYCGVPEKNESQKGVRPLLSIVDRQYEGTRRKIDLAPRGLLSNLR